MSLSSGDSSEWEPSAPQFPGEDDEQKEFKFTGDGVVVRRTRSGGLKKRDGRDQLPFLVYLPAAQTLGDEDQVLGSYRLDSSTSVGDVLDLGPKGVFSVTRVRYLYRHISSRLVVTSKKLEVVPVSTSALQYLQ